jgi:putative hydroxymethylpyrimidine transport system permease protein
MTYLRPIVIFLCLIGAWQALVWLTGVEPFILPGPDRVALALVERWPSLLRHAGITIVEILLGLGLGVVLGCASAIVISALRPARRWLLPVLVVSQAIPVFALAPILVLWLGYGLASKVAMATLIIYRPAVLLHLRIPAALPALTSGLRVATAVAPIGAIVGEWVGSSGGLGYLMLHANARLQADVMFAALFLLALFAVTLYFTVDWALRRAIPWQADDARDHGVN